MTAATPVSTGRDRHRHRHRRRSTPMLVSKAAGHKIDARIEQPACVSRHCRACHAQRVSATRGKENPPATLRQCGWMATPSPRYCEPTPTKARPRSGKWLADHARRTRFQTTSSQSPSSHASCASRYVSLAIRSSACSTLNAPLRGLVIDLLVPGGGIEPPLCCQNWILSPARLPIPPSRLWEGRKVAHSARRRACLDIAHAM